MEDGVVLFAFGLFLAGLGILSVNTYNEYRSRQDGIILTYKECERRCFPYLPIVKGESCYCDKGSSAP